MNCSGFKEGSFRCRKTIVNSQLFKSINKKIPLLIIFLLLCSLSIIPAEAQKTYTVTFTASPLPNGTDWSITFNGQTRTQTYNYLNYRTTGNSVTFDVPTGKYSYTVGSVKGYLCSPSSGSITVNGNGNIVQSLTFSLQRNTVTFTQSGLPWGTRYSVTFNGQTKYCDNIVSTSISFDNVLNGKYSYTVGSVTGYTSLPSSGSITVNSNTNQKIAFSPKLCTVTFTQSGLPWRTRYSVTFNGQTKYCDNIVSTSISFDNVPKGKYSYTVGSVTGYVPSSLSSGSITVDGDTKECIIFMPSHKVTFTQSGLPAGTKFSVTFNGQTLSTTSNSVTFNNIPEGGTYSYTVGSVTGYTSSPSSGSITVNGNTNQKITFSPQFYSVSFIQSGLPSGKKFSVTFNGQTQSTTTSPNTNYLIFRGLMYGTYSYTVGSVTGYTSSPSYGSIPVGKTGLQTIKFSPL